ncbi:MAG TPA: amidohydrolase family protein [Chthoniobacteraceae bacterium]|nr:amidohydrolase family protein [Chthoniobacteraceae bacterium]
MNEEKTDFQVKNLGVNDGKFSFTDHLAHARQQADNRNYKDFLIVDADAHHYETESWPDIVKYIEDPTLRYRAENGGAAGDSNGDPGAMMIGPALDQSNSGRVSRYTQRHLDRPAGSEPRDVQLIRDEMNSIGIDYQVVFPTPMLELGMHPDSRMESALSWAYTRWMTEEILPHEPRMRTMIFLPFNDPEASLRAVKQFGGRPGVAGFMVTAARYRPVHDNVYAKVYRAIEETGLPLGFHSAILNRAPLLQGMNRFLSMHAIGFVIHNLVHLTNLVINGIPERFPKLKFIFIESGLAWIPFIMQRLDNEYRMRSSEAPLLKKLPSEYIRDFYFTTQPMETTNLKALEVTFEMINAEKQLLFASDFPHWDFDLPSTVYDLPFLSENTKRRILGQNAAELFGLPIKEDALAGGLGRMS